MSAIPLPDRQPTATQGSERDQLNSWLDFYRDTLLAKCAQIDDELLATRPLPPSNLSLLGILRHMAAVEWWWFEFNFAGWDTPELIDSATDSDADFNDLGALPVPDVYEMFVAQVARSREQAAAGNFDDMAARSSDRPVNLRWIYIHMIEEYARHCGHADLIRETLDGHVGY